MSLKDLRLAARRSQAEIATACNVSQSAVCRWETGDTKPCRKYRRPLALALGVTEEELAKELG